MRNLFSKKKPEPILKSDQEAIVFHIENAIYDLEVAVNTARNMGLEVMIDVYGQYSQDTKDNRLRLDLTVKKTLVGG
jgi:hypothetical protein